MEEEKLKKERDAEREKEREKDDEKKKSEDADGAGTKRCVVLCYVCSACPQTKTCPRTIHVSSYVSSYYYVSFCAPPSAVVASVFVAVCVCVCVACAWRQRDVRIVFVMYIYGCTLTKKNGN